MKTGLIGKGYWGGVIEPKLRDLTDLKFIADSKTNVRELLPEVDWVFVCSNTTSHFELVRMCLENGKDVFCEKPFTGNYDKAKELMELAKQNGRQLYVDNVFLMRTEIMRMIELFRDNDPRQLTFIWSRHYDNARESLEDGLLYHDLYLTLSLTGERSWEVVEKTDNGKEMEVIVKSGEKLASYFYDYRNPYKQKFISVDSKTFNLSNPSNDPLAETVERIVNNDIDFQENLALTLDTLIFLEKIKAHRNGRSK